LSDAIRARRDFFAVDERIFLPELAPAARSAISHLLILGVDRGDQGAFS
jgi:hypothetical protein